MFRSSANRVFGSMNDPADERVVHLPTVSSGQCFVHLPTESSGKSFVHRSSFIFHVTCIGSALVASRSMIRSSFIVHRSSFIFHVTCIGSALVASRSMIRSSFIVHFSRDLHRLSTGSE